MLTVHYALSSSTASPQSSETILTDFCENCCEFCTGCDGDIAALM